MTGSARATTGKRHELRDQDGFEHVLAIAFGVLLVACGYALARQSVTFASVPYWGGQSLIFASACLFALRTHYRPSAWMLVLTTFTVAEALVKLMYSPLNLKFPDELQHLLGTNNTLAFHRFGALNVQLSISKGYPGLSTVGATVARMTGASAETTALVLGVFFHTVSTLLVSALLRKIVGSLRLGAVAAVVYGCNANFAFFSSMYIYENLAYVFALFAIIAAMFARQAFGASRLSLVAIAVVSIIATIVSHHITAIFLCLGLIILTVAPSHARSRPRLRDRTTAGLALFSTISVVLWFTFVAHQTWAYIAPFAIGLGSSEKQRLPVYPVLPGEGRVLFLPTSPPLLETVVAGAGLLLLFGMCCFGLFNRRLAAKGRVTCLLGALALGALEVARLVSSVGGVVAGRSSIYLYIPVGAGVAIAIDELRNRHVLIRRIKLPILLVAFLGGICIAWPIWWNRLPGGASVATKFERGTNLAQVSASEWARTGLTRNAGRVAADESGQINVGGRAGMTSASGASTVFYANSMNSMVERVIQDRGIAYIWVDLKLSDSYSADGTYYGAGGPAYTTAPTRAELLKFAKVPGLDRLFDNGNIIIYKVTAAFGNRK